MEWALILILQQTAAASVHTRTLVIKQLTKISTAFWILNGLCFLAIDTVELAVLRIRVQLIVILLIAIETQLVTHIRVGAIVLPNPSMYLPIEIRKHVVNLVKLK